MRRVNVIAVAATIAVLAAFHAPAGAQTAYESARLIVVYRRLKLAVKP